MVGSSCFKNQQWKTRDVYKANNHGLLMLLFIDLFMPKDENIAAVVVIPGSAAAVAGSFVVEESAAEGQSQ